MQLTITMSLKDQTTWTLVTSLIALSCETGSWCLHRARKIDWNFLYQPGWLNQFFFSEPLINFLEILQTMFFSIRTTMPPRLLMVDPSLRRRGLFVGGGGRNFLDGLRRDHFFSLGQRGHQFFFPRVPYRTFLILWLFCQLADFHLSDVTFEPLSAWNQPKNLTNSAQKVPFQPHQFIARIHPVQDRSLFFYLNDQIWSNESTTERTQKELASYQCI